MVFPAPRDARSDQSSAVRARHDRGLTIDDVEPETAHNLIHWKAPAVLGCGVAAGLAFHAAYRWESARS